jgi:LysB family phage lysis regulatory protein
MLAQIKLYLAAAAALAFAAVLIVALWYRGQAISAQAQAAQARADLASAVAANAAQQETIGRLRATAEANDRIVTQMTGQLAAINAAVADTNQQIGDLKDANEDVRAYLAGRVPADLDRLLNR